MKVLTVKDISAILKIGITQSQKLMGSPAFPSYRIGKKMFVTEDALENWLKRIQGKQINL